MDRKKLITGTALFVGALLVVFVVVSDSPSTDATSGTMASPDTISGVQPASRYRAPQITENDLDLDDPTFVQLMQNESFREIVRSGDLALITAIEELSRSADLERVKDLAREGGLANVPATVTAKEYEDLAVITQEVGLAEVAEMARDGEFDALRDVVQDEEVFKQIHEAAQNDELVAIRELFQDPPENQDFSTAEVIGQIVRDDMLGVLTEMVQSGSFEAATRNPAEAESEMREALEQISENAESGTPPKGDPTLFARVEEFGRSEAFDRLVDLARAGRLERADELLRSDILERVANLERAGGLGKVADLARIGGLERVDRLERAGKLERVADLARSEDFGRVVDFARSDEFQKAASLERTDGFARTDMERTDDLARTDALERTDMERTDDLARTTMERTDGFARGDVLERITDLARSGQLERLIEFARTDGFDRIVDLERAGGLERVADMARSGELERTMGDFSRTGGE